MNIQTHAKPMSAVQIKRLSGRPELTAEQYRSRANYSPDTGMQTSLISRGGLIIGQQLGTITHHGYRQIFVDYWPYISSRLAWLWMTGAWPDNLIDHINGDRSDDRWCNLRAATYQQNARNRKPCRRNKSGKVGVCQAVKPGFWNANITINDRTKSLGNFECIDDAVAARCEAEKHYFGEFAARRISNA